MTPESGGVLYLDVDDEITSVVGRIRGSIAGRVCLVLPQGSRLASSRINLRLLAREAQTAGKGLALVTQDATVLAVARSAGLSAFATLGEYEAAPVEGASAPPAAAAPGPAGAATTPGAAKAPAAARTPATTRPGSPVAAPGPAQPPAAPTPLQPATGASSPNPGQGTGIRPRSSVPTGRSSVASPPTEIPQPRRPGRRAALVLTVLLVLVAGAGFTAWQLLPQATVVVTTRAEPVGPLILTIRADPRATTVDQAAGVVPAQVVTFSLRAGGDFEASGKKISETTARGSVRWTNCDPTRSYTIPRGTTARTRSGVSFATAASVFLSVAILTGNPPKITCQSREVRVTAAKAGPAGNVAAGAIEQVPSSYNAVVIRVTNPAPTTGGTHTESRVIAQADVDQAVANLQAQLDDQFQAGLADDSRAPAGTSIVPGTAAAGAAQLTPDPAGLVGLVAPDFQLTATATGTVTAVDASLVEDLAQATVRAALAPDRLLVVGSMSVRVGAPTADGAAVNYPVTGRASQVRPLDVGEIRALVRGRPVDEVRAHLRDYGDATVDVWPDWVSMIPSSEFRLDVRVVSEIPVEHRSPPASAGSPAPLASP